MRIILSTIIFSSLIAPNVFAGALIARRQQMEAQRQQLQAQAQQQAQQEYQAQQMQAYQQALAQRQYQEAQYHAAQMQAYQQAVVQYQAAQLQAAQELMAQQAVKAYIENQAAAYIQKAQMEQAQALMVKQAIEQEVGNQIASQIAQGVKQIQQQNIEAAVNAAITAVASRNQTQAMINAAQRQKQQQEYAVQDAYISKARRVAVANAAQQVAAQQVAGAYQQAAYGQAITEAAAIQQQKAAINQALTNQVAAQGAAAMAQQQVRAASQTAPYLNPYANVSSSEVAEVADINDVWAKLDETSRAWALLIDNRAKEMTVQEYIQRFRDEEKVSIKKPAMSYVMMIDDMASQNPEMLQRPFKELMQMVAIMEYDFDNGKDADLLARKVLGENFYQANKRRLGR